MKLLLAAGTAATQNFVTQLVNVTSADLQGLMLSIADKPQIKPHPLWVFEPEWMLGSDALICSLVLFFSGLLCSAGGIGGGGIYVSVLMVAGGLVPHDAVPLSKAVVFFGALASLVLNLRKASTWSINTGGAGRSGSSRALIDYSICRIVVPSALVGTLLGVLFNRLAADWSLIGMLCVILSFMTGMVMKTAYEQYKDEESTGRTSVMAPQERAHLLEGEDVKKTRGMLLQQDLGLAGSMLTVIVVCGVIRHHTSECMGELRGDEPALLQHKACRHPLMNLFPNLAETLMHSHIVGTAIHIFLLALPISVCSAVAWFYSRRECLANEGWTDTLIAKYMAMGVVTGCLSGLVGIGGGLIFSPFFLLMGVDPNIAVATSSTCVLFTSSSTTLQYLLTDRIIMSLALVYGSVNLLASWLGTSFVHFLQDNFHTKRSYITAIVAAGVFTSLVLCTGKLYMRLAEGPSN